MTLPTAPLVAAERIRTPFLLAHIAAYGGGGIVLAWSTSRDPSFGWVLVGYYLVLASAALFALVTGRHFLRTFLLADAVTLPVVPIMTGQHPASVHVSLLVIVLAAAATLSFRWVLAVAAVGGLVAVVGLVLGEHDPLAWLTEAQVTSSENMAMVIGLLTGAIAVTVLSRLLRESMVSQAEALAAEQRSSALQQQFIAMVSHELRTPLTSIRGFAELLSDDRAGISDEERTEFMHAISTQSAHLSRLVDDVLVVLRIHSGKLAVRTESLVLGPVIETAIAMVGPSSGSIVLGSGLDAWVIADGDRLVQVTRNLVENAMKYGGGTVMLSASTGPFGVRLVVEDDGPGIPSHMAEAVFDEFVQLGKPAERVTAGFGLGLPIVRRLVSAMDGAIWYTTSRLGGAGFVVQLRSAV
ncbi:MAG: sensor histidine kinase [Acidimicrobiia bacterium]